MSKTAMKNSPQEYAEMLIDKYVGKLGTFGFANFKSIAIQCAIIDVTNTLDALKEINVMGNTYWYYKEVINILKSKL